MWLQLVAFSAGRLANVTEPPGWSEPATAALILASTWVSVWKLLSLVRSLTLVGIAPWSASSSDLVRTASARSWSKLVVFLVDMFVSS